MSKSAKFKAGQLVKLNAHAITCLDPKSDGFRMITEAGYQDPEMINGFIHTVPIGEPCLIIRIDKEANDNLVMLHGDVLVRICDIFVELAI